jgi:5'-nucleotidase/UDP-sugar diphosphatase
VRWLVAVVLAGSVSACGAASVARGPEPAAAGGPKRCLLLTTNDSESNFDGPRLGQGYLQPVARVAQAKRDQLARRPGGVLLVEGGDVLQGRYMERRDGDRGLAMRLAWQVYEAAGYDFGTVGNHEFDGGPKLLRAAMEGLQRYRLLSANLEAEGTSLDPTHRGRPDGLFGSTALVDCGGIRIGLFGLTTPSTRTISQIGDVRFGKDPVAGPARAVVHQLRQAGAQVVVALTHLGVSEDVDLARDVSGIDAIVGGHSHTPLFTVRRVGATWITQTGSRFAWLGELDLALDADGEGLDPQQTRWRLRKLDESLPIAADIAAHVNGLRTTLVDEVVIGQRSVAWDLTVPHGDYGRRAARATAAAAQAALAATLHIDGAALNAGGLRSHSIYPPGPVTNLDVQAIHPFANRVVVVSLSGEQLRDLLEHGCQPASDSHGQSLVLWGLSGTCTRDRRGPEYRWVDGRPVQLLRRGERVEDARIHGQPLEMTRRYTIATIDYLARGGSGFLAMTLGERRCLDGQPWQPDATCRSPILHEVITAAVRDGSLDAPLAPTQR